MTLKLLQVADREAWRAWLQKNHAVEKEAWLIINKKHAARPGISYEEALEEALCFGWIDGLLRSTGGETFSLRFSPRKSRSIWSEGNKQRAERLIELGRMTEAGMAAIRAAKENGEWDKAAEREDTSILPSDLEEGLQRDGRIWSDWESLAPSRKKQYIYWITSAKTEETRQRRILETVRLAAERARG
jgi:uncharacterized protein YdeI (YjbR/CyaY-like superfamily)